MTAIALIACLGLAASTLAAAAPVELKLLRISDKGTLALEVSGQWPGNCEPRLDPPTRDGDTLLLRARQDSADCKAGGDGFRLRSALQDFDPQEARVLRVRFEAVTDPLAPARLMAFELFSFGDLPQPEPEGGFWWSEAGGEFDHASPGLGAQLERQGDMLALTFSGYADDGRPEWLFGASPLLSPVTDVALSRLAGGSGPFDGYRGPDQSQAAGRLQIEWHGNARATFWFSRTTADGKAIGLFPVSMVRFDFGHEPGAGWQGDWALDRGPEQPIKRLRLEHLVLREEGFQLHSTEGDILACRRAAGRPLSPPEYCELALADGLPPLSLANVGLGRLDGRSADGETVRLIRLQPR